MTVFDIKSMIVRWLLLCYIIFVNGQSYQEKYRLQLHYSIPTGWSNDPNGLIYIDGYYQLFYQHNPVSTVFGPMHWGHARSNDLIHWETLPIAIKPYEKGVIFSGCCVYDENNVSGIVPKKSINNQDTSEKPVIAVYTLNNDGSQSQSQALAYSFDNGTTWTQYDENPVLPNQGIPDFRDPNIIERDGKFIMALAVRDRISFFESTDLKSWDKLMDFGVSPDEGDKSAVWECPSLFTLSDEQGNEHDILIVSLNEDQKGSRTQYFIGKFNGTRFNTYDQSRILWVDNGYDNYAAIPYHNDPLGRIVIIGWLSNWLYGQVIPTSTWRGQMTIPRELTLQTINGNLHLAQRPVDELNSIIDSTRNWSLSEPIEITGNQIIDLTSKIPFKTGSMLSLNYVFDIEKAKNGQVAIRFSNNQDEFITLHYNINEKTFKFDRSSSGDVSFHPGFADELARIDRISDSNLLSGQIILDTGSIEIFADDGLNTISSIFFPTEPYENIDLLGYFDDDEQSVTVQELSVAALNSIWTK